MKRFSVRLSSPDYIWSKCGSGEIEISLCSMAQIVINAILTRITLPFTPEQAGPTIRSKPWQGAVQTHKTTKGRKS